MRGRTPSASSKINKTTQAQAITNNKHIQTNEHHTNDSVNTTNTHKDFNQGLPAPKSMIPLTSLNTKILTLKGTSLKS